jgi:hypothetical protein
MRAKLRSKISLLFMTFALVLAVPTVAFAADGLNADADSLATGTANHSNSFSATQAPGTTVSYDFSGYIQPDGNTTNDVFAAAGDTVTATNTFVGSWLANSGSTATLQWTAYNQNQVGKIAITVPCDATAGASETMTATLSAAASNGKSISPSSRQLSYNITAGSTQDASCNTPPANNAPTVMTAALDALGNEGDTLQASGAFQDADNDSLSLSADNGTVGTFTDNGDGTWTWSLSTNDDVALNTITVTANDGNGGTATDSFDYRALNADPVLSGLSVGGNSGTACIGGNTVTLGFSFSDVGSNDSHSGTIDWGDNSTDGTFTTSPVSTSHSYSPGTYNISVNVADDDGGTDSVVTSGSDSVSLLYNLSGLLAPVNLNGTSVFKYGSTIPMKVTILDCDNLPVSGLSPSIKFRQISGTAPNTDINETVSTSAADTNNYMRYSDGIYIYNLASKSLPDPTATYKAVISDASSSPNPLISQLFGLKK